MKTQSHETSRSSYTLRSWVVALPEDYYFSSARNYAGLENDLDVVMLDLF
jgi:hypothetical protein